MISFLADEPLLVLFLVAGIGFILGKVRAAGFSLGVSAVLFVGLAAGALDKRLALPEIVYQLGLVVFVYTIAVTSGPGFLSALRRRGLRDNLLVFTMLVIASGLALLAYVVTDLSGGQAAGLFSGSLTNTPSLAAVIEHLRATGETASDPVVAFSLTYPVGVVGMLLAIYVSQRLWRVDYAREAAVAVPWAHEPILSQTFVVDRDDLRSVDDVLRKTDAQVLFTRVQHKGHVAIPEPEMPLAAGDLVNVVGAKEEVERVSETLGRPTHEYLPFDRRELDTRRIFVSSRSVLGRRIGDLDLARRFGAVITRVRRGDVDVLARDDMTLEPGDRVRVVAPRDAIPRVTEYFGDSFRALSELDVLTFSIGLALGLLLGAISVPLPGGASLQLGIAGGPLVIGLILGARGRTGPLVWHLPYNVSITLRQFGVVLFLAGIGTRAGDAFAETVASGGLKIVAAGAIITTFTALATLIVAHKVLGAPMGVSIGMLAGLQTQPAVLAYATEQAGEEMPHVGYATVFPLAMIAKIVLAQIIVLVLT